MKKKRKEHFINDKRRVSYLSSVYTRMYRGKSVLIEGAYGAGKTRFLQLIQPKKLKPVWLESLDNKHEILASILQELNYEGVATHWHTSRNLKKICSLTGFFIVIDEANDLDRRVWPYFKRIIDAYIPMVFAGLPKVRTYLASEHPDILSRLKVLTIYPIIVEDFIAEYKNFSSEAIEQIYAATDGDMRKFEEICIECQDKAKELKYSLVDINLALTVLTDLPSNH
ncbi:putative transposase (ATPase domain protein) [Desulfosarcina variabilis str. Montpellier]|uniref:ATP-binding protein n=1 Tax=Desulfosarcina variabilis TaxID=2300 RepID=UPI003AFAB96D